MDVESGVKHANIGQDARQIGGADSDQTQEHSESVEVRSSTLSVCRSVTVAISPGELADRRTILKIKTQRFKDPEKRAAAVKELARLPELPGHLTAPEEVKTLQSRLWGINMTLWQVEEDLRACEKERRFGKKFVELARSVYRLNDQRSTCKWKINKLFSSDLTELKEYV